MFPPLSACSNKMGDASAYDQAAELLLRIHGDAAFNATWGAYWASLPGPDELLVAELFTKEQTSMLQHPALVSAFN